MITSKDHSNKPLISITDGKKLGEVKGLFLDGEMRQVTAVFLGKEGIINRKVLAIARSAVQVYGIDAWLVSGSDKVMTLENIPDSATFTLANDLRGREVQTEGGTKLGTIEDVVLDSEMRVLGFALGKVYAQGPLAERKAIAREAITDLGNKDKPMTAILGQAESLSIP
ncbi:MAG TPA: PRC-barrel domain-containing protein [Anaerolineales bacterium]|nr:PRC-barrel domain-containing protein [Anaerolineales bacterium]